jgi:poly-gamma-glutamate synthesis protein (capsule biosynthesis protein)
MNSSIMAAHRCHWLALSDAQRSLFKRLLLPFTPLLVVVLVGCGKNVQSDAPETIRKTARGNAPETIRKTARGNAPETIRKKARGTNVSVVFVGDILLGDAAAKQFELNGYDWSFEHVKNLIADSDVVIGNLEGPITTAKKMLSKEKKYSYKVKPASAPALKRAGFHAMSLANNHTLDYGPAGMFETIALLRTNDIVPFGAGGNEAEARRGIVYDFGTIRLGVLGYADDWDELRPLNWYAKGAQSGCARLSTKNLQADIGRMRQYADVVVISAHWGSNYKDVKNSQKEMGRRAIDLGADIVCGHHPHIAQGIEIYRGKPIIYSVGNFVFGTRGRYEKEEDEYGLVSRWVFEGKSLKWLVTTPIAVNNKEVNFQPQRVAAEEARRMFQPRLQAFNTAARWEGGTAFIGFGPDWQTAALPAVPWIQATTNAVKAAGGIVPATASSL